MKIILLALLILVFPILLNSQEVLISTGTEYGGYNQDLAWNQSILAAVDCNSNVSTITTMPTATDVMGKDIKFSSAPESDFSTGAVSEMANGGVLFFIDEHSEFVAFNDRIDLLLGNLDSKMFYLNNIIGSQCNNAGFEFEVLPNNSCIMQGIYLRQSIGQLVSTQKFDEVKRENQITALKSELRDMAGLNSIIIKTERDVYSSKLIRYSII